LGRFFHFQPSAELTFGKQLPKKEPRNKRQKSTKKQDTSTKKLKTAAPVGAEF
jgi:hypothetical protein